MFCVFVSICDIWERRDLDNDQGGLVACEPNDWTWIFTIPETISDDLQA